MRKNIPEIDVDEIMQKIREEVIRRKKYVLQTDGNDIPTQEIRETAIWRLIKKIQYKLQKYAFYSHAYNTAYKFKKFIPKYKQHSLIGELIKYHNEDFIKNAYRVILKREPDSQGFNQYLVKLRNGKLSKIDILGRLRYSEEGRQKHIKIKGLFLRFLINTSFHIPVFGYLIKLLVSLVSLPMILSDSQKYEILNEKRFNSIKEQLAQKIDIQNIKGIKKDINNLSIQIKNYNSYVFNLQKNLTLLNDKVKDKLEENRLPDSLYLSFEERFRGSKKDIKGRAEVYLPYIKKSNAGTLETPILDVGCGRGEWLQLLGEHGYVAKGVDSNSAMIQQCKSLGLDVEESDVIEYLRKQRSNSLGAITGFHIIEHLPLKTLLELLDESLRVLKTGGIVIFETPNPENIIVGACNFYLDPTHRSPLPSSLMKFLCEFSGFSRVEILYLNPFSEEFKSSDSGLVEWFNKHFYGPQDYAIIGWKE